jgi:energy-converting hydrogenase Eha subunit A
MAPFALALALATISWLGCLATAVEAERSTAVPFMRPWYSAQRFADDMVVEARHRSRRVQPQAAFGDNVVVWGHNRKVWKSRKYRPKVFLFGHTCGSVQTKSTIWFPRAVRMIHRLRDAMSNYALQMIVDVLVVALHFGKPLLDRNRPERLTFLPGFEYSTLISKTPVAPVEVGRLIQELARERRRVADGACSSAQKHDDLRASEPNRRSQTTSFLDAPLVNAPRYVIDGL